MPFYQHPSSPRIRKLASGDPEVEDLLARGYIQVNRRGEKTRSVVPEPFPLARPIADLEKIVQFPINASRFTAFELSLIRSVIVLLADKQVVRTGSR